MGYTSEELTNGFYRDNNSYEEIGELHANSKQAVVGRIDSRYNSTKKISLQAPDSDRLIYNFSSDSKVSDMAIRYAYDNVSEKMMFVGKDFLAIYDSESGNFVLKEPHEFLKVLINPFDIKIDPGLGGLADPNNTKLTYDQLDFICKSMKYVFSADKYFFVISELDNGHSVIWKIDPDTLKINKFRPKDFYDGPGSEVILAKPFVYDGIMYVYTKTANNRVRVWSCNVNDDTSNTQFTYVDDLADPIGEVSNNSFCYIIDNVNGYNVVKAFNIHGDILSAVHYRIGHVNEVTKYEVQDVESVAGDYKNNSIKYIKKVGLTNNVHIILLLKNGLIKVIDNGYSNNSIQIKTRRGLTCKAFIKYLEKRLDSENHNYPVIKLYNNSGFCRILNSDVGEYNYGTLSTSGNAAIDVIEFDDKDELLYNFDNNYDILGYTEYGNKTIIFGWFNENGIIKPLIKEIDPKKEGYSVNKLNPDKSELIRPFRSGLEPDSGISIVKNVSFGGTKTVRLKLTPNISETAVDNEPLFFRETDSENSDGKYTTGSILWNALKRSGIPYNTHIKSIGRIILDGYDIPIESVLITRPDESKDYGSVLLSFDKMFDITMLDKKYLKLGNILYPGILFKNNKGFLNDAMISNVYNVDSTFAYDDANNGNVFEDFALSISSAIVLNDTNDNIVVVASNNGKISSINLNTGSYITASGTTYGENAPWICSKEIPYNWVKDGEIIALIKCPSKPAFYVLYTSGKIVEYRYANPVTITVIENNHYVSESDGYELNTVYSVKGTTLAYYINDGSKKLNFFDLDSNNTDVKNIENYIALPSANSLYINVNGSFFYIHETQLIKFNPISGTYTVFANNLPSGSNKLCWDFNDRIYVTNENALVYVELSTKQIQTRVVAGTNAFRSFILYYNNKLYSVNEENKLFAVNDEDEVIINEITFNSDANDIKQIFIDSNETIVIYTNGVDKLGRLHITDSETVSVDEFEVNSITAGNSIIYDGNKFKYLYDSNNHSISLSDVIHDISSDTDIPSSGSDEFIGLSNNILYLKFNNMVYAKDLRKSLLNYINRLVDHDVTIRTENSKPVTAIGFIDDGNTVAICFADGAIESVYLPEYNSVDGYYKSDYADIIESYSRTIFERTVITLDQPEVEEGEDTPKEVTTTLKEIAKPSKLGYSFIGWSTEANEDGLISINKAAGDETIIHNNDVLYAVFKDNHEEYVDRCVTRMFAKTGELFNNGVISINQIKEDVYFQSSDKSVRWANDIGVFFEGHDEKFTGKNTTNKGIYNGNQLASKLYINGAGSVNVGKYIFYINGYNPSSTNPQTTAHNGIVVYDSQNDEYSVMSKGTDKLHGTILSRVFPFCYYHEGYIYIFGGLERRDIHTADGNNYSRFHRTNKIERFDIRNGENVILDTTFGPGDRFLDTNNTNLVYAGEDEIRHLNEVDDGLEGIINIKEYNELYSYRFNFSDETSTLSSINTTELDEVPLTVFKGKDISLVLKDSKLSLRDTNDNVYDVDLEGDGFDITDPIKVYEHLEFIIRTAKSFTILGYDEDDGFIEISRIRYTKNDPLNKMYFAPSEHCKYRVSNLFDIGNKELLLDNTPVIGSSIQNYIYAYSKAIFKNPNYQHSNVDNVDWTDIGDNDSVEFINDFEFLFKITSHELVISKKSPSGDNTDINVKVNKSGTKVKTIVGTDDVITCLILDNSNKIIDIVSYNIDKSIAITRNFSGDYKITGKLFYDRITKKIFVASENATLCITGIDVNSVDSETGITINSSEITGTILGYDSIDATHIALFLKRIESNKTVLITEIRKIDAISGSLEGITTSSSVTLNFDFSDRDITDVSLINGQFILHSGNEYFFVHDSNNVESVKIPLNSYVYSITEDGILYLQGTKRYKIETRFKAHNAGTFVLPLNKEFSKLDNSYICMNEDNIFVYANSVIFRINKYSKEIFGYEGVLDNLGREYKIVAITADNDSLYLFDGIGSKIIKFDLTRKILTSQISVNNLNSTSNVVSDLHDGTIYFIVENVLYKIINDEAVFLKSGLTTLNVTSMKLIEDKNVVRYSAINNPGDSVQIYELNIDTLEISEKYSFNTPIRTEQRIIEYANIGMRQYSANFAIDKYGNIIIVGGNKTSVDYIPSHITTIDGSNINNFKETIPEETPATNKMVALRTIVDDNNMYSLGIGNGNVINVVFSERNENDLKGNVNFTVGSRNDNRNYFTYNNELFCVEASTSTFRILKYNKTINDFSIYSSETIEKIGSYVSCHAYSDGTMYSVFLSTSGGEIKFNVVCYNINTKKLVSSVTETVYTSLNTNIGDSLKIIDNNSWNGKYFTTILGTGSGSDNIIVSINVLKLNNIKVLGRTISPSGGILNNTAAYFNSKVYHFGTENNVYKTKLTNIDLNNTETVNVTLETNGGIENDRVTGSSTVIVSGSRMIVTGIYEPIETNISGKIFSYSNSNVKQKTLNNNKLLILPDNKVAIGNNISSNAEAPVKCDLAKTPVKSIDFSSDIAIRIYSGVNEDVFVSYNPSNNDRYDYLVISREYASSIKDVVKLNDNSFIVLHADTPRISTIVVNDNGRLSFKRYDGVNFGSTINSGTNIHTIQEADLTMLFDSEMDEYALRQPSI